MLILGWTSQNRIQHEHKHKLALSSRKQLYLLFHHHLYLVRPCFPLSYLCSSPLPFPSSFFSRQFPYFSSRLANVAYH